MGIGGEWKRERDWERRGEGGGGLGILLRGVNREAR